MSETLFDHERLVRLRHVITDDIAAGRYFGAVIAVARAGRLGLHEAIGHGPEKLPVRFTAAGRAPRGNSDER